MSCTRMTTAFLTFGVISLCYFWQYIWISRLLCNWNTLWNISMVLGRIVAQDQTTCHIQEWQLCLSYFWCYLPLLAHLSQRLKVSFCDWSSAIVRHASVNNLLKRHLLLNWWMDFKIILQECSLGDPLPKLPKWFCSAKQNGCQS